MALSFQIRLLTYNVHYGIGRDGRYDLARIAAVIRQESPDVVALQETDNGVARSRRDDQVGWLTEALGFPHSARCVTRRFSQGDFGLALLSRFPIIKEERYDLSHRQREPRYCFRADLEIETGARIHVFNCHLGLSARERRFQQSRMLSKAILLSEELKDPVVLMGDFNDRPVPVVHRRLRGHFVDVFRSIRSRCGHTFRWGPLALKLDHIYTSPGVRVLTSRVGNGPLSLVASDHRPLFAIIELNGPTASPRSGSSRSGRSLRRPPQ